MRGAARLRASHREPGVLIEVAQQRHLVSARRTAETVLCAMCRWKATRCGSQRRRKRRLMIRGSVRVGVLPGQQRRLERSAIAAGLPVRYRSAHFLAGVGDTWNRSAARRIDHSSSTIEVASFNRPFGVSKALASSRSKD